jgi:hypothetical protein
MHRIRQNLARLHLCGVIQDGSVPGVEQHPAIGTECLDLRYKLDSRKEGHHHI